MELEKKFDSFLNKEESGKESKDVKSVEKKVKQDKDSEIVEQVNKKLVTEDGRQLLM